MTSIPSFSRHLDEVLSDEMEQWRAKGLERHLRAGWARTGGEVETDTGRAIDFSCNDYLGLAHDRRLTDAMTQTLKTETVGATASRLIAGNHPEHEALEGELAQFFAAPAALTFNNGFTANVGSIPALVAGGDVVFADAFNHASLIDGCRLSRADVHVYSHSDMAALRELLVLHRPRARRAMIVTDGLFSMDGDAANLSAIVELAREFDCWTYVDDAHAVGAVGPHGRGTADQLNIHGEIDVTMGTLGKAFGVAGAFIYGSTVLCQHLMNRARSFVYSTAMLPAQAAAARVALSVVASEPQRRGALRANSRSVRQALAGAGAIVDVASESHIVPVFIGDAADTMRMGLQLKKNGVLVGAVRPPTVAHGSSRLRVSVSAAHTPAQIAALAGAFSSS